MPRNWRGIIAEVRATLLHPHDVVTRVDEENFPRDVARQWAAQEEGGVAHVALLDVMA